MTTVEISSEHICFCFIKEFNHVCHQICNFISMIFQADANEEAEMIIRAIMQVKKHHLFNKLV